MPDVIAIAREGRTWIVKHNDGVLGHAGGPDEARRVAQILIDWLKDEGRSPELRIFDDAMASACRPGVDGRSAAIAPANRSTHADER